MVNKRNEIISNHVRTFGKENVEYNALHSKVVEIADSTKIIRTVERVRGGMRLVNDDIRVVGDGKSCVHDAIINAYYQLGFPINKQKLYKEIEPSQSKNRTIMDIYATKEVSRFPVNIYPVKFDENCKREYSFLKLRYQGVFLAIAKVTECEDK